MSMVMNLLNNFRLPPNVIPFNVDCPLLTPPIVVYNGYESLHDYDNCPFFKCSKCDLKSSFISDNCHLFDHHLHKKHENEQLYCLYCYWNDRDFKPKQFYYKNGLISHIINDHSFRKYQCNLCHYRASFISNVIQHQTISHNKQYEYAISKNTLKKKKICKIIICESVIFGPEMNAFMYYNMFKVEPINRNTNKFQCVYCNYVNDRNYVFLHCAHKHADFPMMVYKPVFDDPKMEMIIKAENEQKNINRKKRNVNVCNENNGSNDDINGNVTIRIDDDDDGNDSPAKKRNIDGDDDKCEKNNKIEEIDVISDDSSDVTDAVISLDDNFNYISLLEMSNNDDGKRNDNLLHNDISTQNGKDSNVLEVPRVSERPLNSGTDVNPPNLRDFRIRHLSEDNLFGATDSGMRHHREITNHREMLDKYRKNPKIRVVRKDSISITHERDGTESVNESIKSINGRTESAKERTELAKERTESAKECVTCSLVGDVEWHRNECPKYKNIINKQITDERKEKKNKKKSKKNKIPKNLKESVNPRKRVSQLLNTDVNSSKSTIETSNATFNSTFNDRVSSADNVSVNNRVSSTGNVSVNNRVSSTDNVSVNNRVSSTVDITIINRINNAFNSTINNSGIQRTFTVPLPKNNKRDIPKPKRFKTNVINDQNLNLNKNDVPDNMMMRCLMCPHCPEFKKVNLNYHFEKFHGLTLKSSRYVCALCYRYNGTVSSIEKHHNENHRNICDQPKVREFVVPHYMYREIEEERQNILQNNDNNEIQQNPIQSVSDSKTPINLKKNKNSKFLSSQKKDNKHMTQLIWSLKKKRIDKKFKKHHKLFKISQSLQQKKLLKKPIKMKKPSDKSLIDVQLDMTREEREESDKMNKLRLSEAKEKRKENLNIYKKCRDKMKSKTKSKEQSPIPSTSFAISASRYSTSSDDFIHDDDDTVDDDDVQLIKQKKSHSKSNNCKKLKAKRKNRGVRTSEYIVSPRKTDSSEESDYVSDENFVVGDDVIDKYKDGHNYHMKKKNDEISKHLRESKNRKRTHSGQSKNSNHEKLIEYVCLFCDTVLECDDMKVHLKCHFQNLDNDTRKLEKISKWADDFINSQLSLSEFDDETVMKVEIRCPICVKVGYEIGRNAKSFTELSKLNEHLCIHMQWKPSMECAIDSECLFISEEFTNYYNNLYCDMQIMVHLNEKHSDILPCDDEYRLRGRKVRKELPLDDDEREIVYKHFVRKSDKKFDNFYEETLKDSGEKYDEILRIKYLTPDKFHPKVIVEKLCLDHVDFNDKKSMRKFLKKFK